MANHRVVVAVGGNSITRPGDSRGIPGQYETVRTTSGGIVDLIEKGWEVAIGHGNGPQIGMLIRRIELSQKEVYPLPYDTCAANVQGGMGYMLQQVLGNMLSERGVRRSIATLITQVVVDADDPAFRNPTKPIGRFYTEAEARLLIESEGWTMREDAGRGWRRVIASPTPLEIVEIDAISALVDSGTVAITVGGGGIPVVRTPRGLEGVPAVIDKDLASSLLARLIGADLLIITTAVDAVQVGFGTPDARDLPRMTAAEAGAYLRSGEFKPGSMEPKVRACVEFVQATGGRALITSPERLSEAMEGGTGTWIVA